MGTQLREEACVLEKGPWSGLCACSQTYRSWKGCTAILMPHPRSSTRLAGGLPCAARSAFRGCPCKHPASEMSKAQVDGNNIQIDANKIQKPVSIQGCP